ncbi:hypothetical protein [Microbulbifer sp. SSSA005]|uniref:hypothetical protein n=1 Tax=Microbulbifer sp. SSSA005 TaxID=3243378 RepID=UPI004039A6C1
MDAVSSSEVVQTNIQSKFLKKAIGSTLLIALGVIIMIGSSQGVMLPLIDKPEIWFQRSGAIAVLIAVYIEYIAQHQLKSISALAYEGISLSSSYSTYFDWISKSCIALAIIGTVIWGYGDLLYLVAA